MGEPIVTLATVVINVRDLERAKTFWTTVLGVEVVTEQEVPGFFSWLRPQLPGGISVSLQVVDHPKPGPNQVHIDTTVDDIDEARTRIEALGGSFIAEHEFDGFRWNIMGDPEGNEFCISSTHP